MKIWCVEDDSSIRDIEVYTLHSTGFEARGFADGAAFRAALETEEPDLVVLELLQFLRGNPATAEIPIIMATAKGMEYDKIQSLDLGADDYLVKPFGMMEMVSRIKAILRRYKPAQVQHVRKAGGLVINLDEYTVTADGERVTLTLKEFELLKLFLSHPGIAFTRDQLFNEIWGIDYMGETRTVDVHIRTLRQKLGAYGSLIETVRGVGYRLEVQA